MTENEALGYLKNSKRQKSMLGILPGSDIGNTIIKALEELKQYRAIGTPEECRAAMERQNPRAAITEKEDTGTTRYICPTCGMYMGWSTGTFPARYCWKCGQKLDWGDEE